MILPDNKIKEWISEGKLLINEDGSTIFSPIVQNISYDLSTRKFYSKEQDSEGLIVTSNYLATNRDRRRCDRKVTPFFCVRRLILQYWVR